MRAENKQENKPEIKPVVNGPYIVKELKNLSNQKGSLKTEDSIVLCRCGKSSNKPYCDGSHAKTGFSTDNTEAHLDNRQDVFIGQTITIFDNRSICAHAGICTDNLSAVFRMKQEPWIDPDAADIEDIIRIIEKCPSGALSYALQASDDSEKDKVPGIFIAANGPYVISGCPELTGADWRQGASRQQYTLCRCGASKNKPFCDGSHWSINFNDSDN